MRKAHKITQKQLADALDISCYEDMLVENVIAQILEIIYEGSFLGWLVPSTQYCGREGILGERREPLQ